MSNVNLDIWFAFLNVWNILIASLMTQLSLSTIIWMSDDDSDKNLDLDKVLSTTVDTSSAISD